MPDETTLHRLKEVKLSPLNLQALTDVDGNGVADALEKPLKQAKPITYSMLQSNKKHHVWKAVKATLAGETTVGVIGAEIKNVLKRFIPFGEEIDALTDQVGHQLKSKRTKNNIMSNQAETLAAKIKRFIKQPSTQAGVSFVLMVIGGIWSGVHIDAATLTNSVVGVVTALAGVYTAVANLINIFRDEAKSA